ncbi:uncharacterized protein LOC120351379 isoform X1 [Nilaparvata lugens]|uniref:uncharacterized protein LOC120351379 isoform X1 n=1 Tax=Nilaparvata lugens TaxID=108931 RepID=UPI00193EA6F5|nr:uncharacterized protein LOC120351379 isoform X1 [Nilaparvata lugens]
MDYTIERSTSINSSAVRYRFVFRKIFIDVVQTLLQILKPKVIELIVEESDNFDKNIKWYFVTTVQLKKVNVDSGSSSDQSQQEEIVETMTNASFYSYTSLLINVDEQLDILQDQFISGVEKIESTLDKFIRYGSGWSVVRIISFDLNITRYNPLAGGNSTYIETPAFIKAKRAVINVKNTNDSKCFVWSVLSYFHYRRRNMNVDYLMQFENNLNLTGIKFPTTVHDIKKFEVQNLNISITVIAYDAAKKKFFPYRCSIYRQREHKINLLLLSNDTTPKKWHYVLINTCQGYNGLSRLLSHHLSLHNGQVFICPYCFNKFTTNRHANCDGKTNLEKHMDLCSTFAIQRTVLPKQGEMLKFKNFSYTLKNKYIAFADFESFIVPTNNGEELDDDDDENVDDLLGTDIGNSFTRKTQKHVACGYAFIILDESGEIFYGPRVYRATSVGEKIIEQFLDEIIAIGRNCSIDMQQEVPMIELNEEQLLAFNNSTVCFLCNDEFKANEIRIRHHSHTTGHFLGATHKSCNLNAKAPKLLNCFFHNFRGYDSHFIVKALAGRKEKIDCIANSSEKFLTITIDRVRFLDSFQFLSSSLQSLVANLASDTENIDTNFKVMCKIFNDKNQQKLLLRKGVYPYQYITDAEKFEEQQLPAIDSFYSTLSNTALQVDDYEHAQKVWREFNINSLGEYHDLYLLSDCLLLADIFQNFRTVFFTIYKLDVSHFVSLPHFSLNAMLYLTKVRLELISNADMNLLIESGLRGGLSVIPHRHAVANNKYMGANYNPAIENSFLLYLDCTSLYAHTMIAYKLPESNFRFLSQDEITALGDFTSIHDEAETGYIIEADLSYPVNLHELHNSFPLAPLKDQPPYNLFSPYQTDNTVALRREAAARRPSPDTAASATASSRLLATLYNRKRYVLHYRNLKLYLSLGMKLTAVHRVIAFHQSYWLKPFIDLNAQLRKEAKNSFERTLFKFLSNSLFGKLMENNRKRIDFKLITCQKKLESLIAKPSCKRWIVFDKDIVAVQMCKTEIKLDRPIYAGFSILDLSKFTMFNFHYNIFLKMFDPSCVKLCMSDTDSLLYHIKSDNIYAVIKQNLQHFDTSAYPVTHCCYSQLNHGVPGTFKDELKSGIITAFCGLRAKLYSFEYVLSSSASSGSDSSSSSSSSNNSSSIKDSSYEKFSKHAAKGVARTIINNKLRYDMYMKCLTDRLVQRECFSQLRSYSHDIYQISCAKVALSPFDTKRYIESNGIDTKAWGHYLIEERRREDIDSSSSNTASGTAVTSD